MTTSAPAIQGAQSAQDAAAAWQQVHADPTIQYTPIEVVTAPATTPEWLLALDRILSSVLEPILRALGLSWPVLRWVLLALAIAPAAYAGMRMGQRKADKWAGGK